jgi:hypothetical protein
MGILKKIKNCKRLGSFELCMRFVVKNDPNAPDGFFLDAVVDLRDLKIDELNNKKLKEMVENAIAVTATNNTQDKLREDIKKGLRPRKNQKACATGVFSYKIRNNEIKTRTQTNIVTY